MRGDNFVRFMLDFVKKHGDQLDHDRASRMLAEFEGHSGEAHSAPVPAEEAEKSSIRSDDESDTN